MDRVLLQGFEWYLPEDASHWKRLGERAADLKKAGITAVWMPPAYKGANGCQDVGYGVYDLYDLGEFEQKGSIATKYGTKEEYLQAIEALHREGIEVVADIVLNHKMGADGCENVRVEAVNETNRNQIIGRDEISAWTTFYFPGRNRKYSDFCWNHTHFDGVDWDDRKKRNQIFQFEGKEWDGEVDTENGNYDYLMGADLDMNNSEVVEELKRWGEWYIQMTDIDGVRLDAVKHICFTFFTDWLSCLRQRTGRELWAVGEYWSPKLESLLHYIEKSGEVMSLFDVPLHFHFMQASVGNGNFDMSKIFEGTLTQAKPNLAVTFVDNHDTQPGQALQSWVEPWFKPLAYALILLRKEGTPSVFYGDYYGIPHDGILPMQNVIDRLLKVRKEMDDAGQQDYLDGPNIIGWVRKQNERCCAVVMSDSVGGTKKMLVGEAFLGQRFADVLGNCKEEVEIGADGYGTFPVEGGSVSVWKAI